jgi:predicted cobalt transporter CbtA
MGNRREFIEGWLSPWSRNLMMIVGFGLVVFSLVMIRNGVVSNDFTVIVEGVVVGFVGWLISTLLPDPTPAPRKPMRRRAAMLARVGGHQLP